MTLYEYFKNLKNRATEQLRTCIETRRDFWTERKDFAQRVLDSLSVEEAELKVSELTSYELEQIINAA